MPKQQKMPEPFNREAILVRNIDGELGKYHTRDTPFQKFVRNEVDVMGAYFNESLIPQHETSEIVFVGEWIRHKGSRLYIRATYEGLVDRIALAQFPYIITEGVPIWSYVCTGDRDHKGKFFSHSPNYGLTLDNIAEATRLITELECALKTYGLVKI